MSYYIFLFILVNFKLKSGHSNVNVICKLLGHCVIQFIKIIHFEFTTVNGDIDLLKINSLLLISTLHLLRDTVHFLLR